MRMSKHIGTAAGGLTAAAVPASVAARQQDDVEKLVREFTGKAEAIGRSEGQLEEAYGRVIEALISAQKLPGIEGQPKHVLEEIIIREGAPGQQQRRKCLLRAMLAYLSKTRDLNQRVYLLRQLGVVGREESVPALAPLLKDKSEAVRQYALRALEMNSSPAAGSAIADVLADAEEPRWRLALINALGSRREAPAVGVLRPLTRIEEGGIAEAAAMALGNIGTPEATKALAAARTSRPGQPPGYLIRASLLCADRLAAGGQKATAAAIYHEIYFTVSESLFRMAALRGLAVSKPDVAVPLVIKALGSSDTGTQAQAARLVVEIPGPEAAKAFAQAMPKLPPSAQAFLLEALAEREGSKPEAER